ncbi:MAG: hypothetical protein GX845_04185 [Erysipelothrix sp.]|jgi:hypothetical protein|nr:hypothetical protein [Erysipelothrix sp.]
MKIISNELLLKEAEIFKKFKDQQQAPISYIKSASFLHFHQRTHKAIELLNMGLHVFPNHEELIRTLFSFHATSYDVLAALEFADLHHSIFEDDEFDNITKALDLVIVSLSLTPPDYLNDDEINACTDLLHVDLNDHDLKLEETLDCLRYQFHLPRVALGIAYELAQHKNPMAQRILGEAYLFNHFGLDDVEKGLAYLKAAKAQNDLQAQTLLDLFYLSRN